MQQGSEPGASNTPACRLSIIVAMDRNRVIGKDNRLPWHISEDLKRFKALTMGHPIIMGRKTFESIGRVLPGRLNIIVTRQAGYACPPGTKVAGSVEEAIGFVKEDGEAFVIGGRELYEHALESAHRLYITEVEGSFDGDTSFPRLEPAHWREIAREHRAVSGAGYNGYDFVTYDRIMDPS